MSPDFPDFPAIYNITGPTGKKIADNWADLLDYSIDQTLQSADIITSSWWSGSFWEGSVASSTCNGFMDIIYDGGMGLPSSTFQTWIYSGDESCTSQYRVLCLAWQ